MQLLRNLRVYLYIFLDLLSRFIPSFSKVRYDLIIVRVDALGDYVIWHDALSAYKEKFKGRKVLLVCADLLSELVEQEDFFSEFFFFNTTKLLKSPWRYWKTLRQLKSMKADLVLYPCWERHLRGDIFSSQISSQKKVSMVSRGLKHCYSWIYNRTYNRLLEYKETPSEIRAVEYFTQKVINPNYIYGLNPIKPSVTPIGSLSNPYVVIAFSAAIKERSWELEKFSAVIDSIPQKYGIVLTGTGDLDCINATRILESVHNRDRVVNMVNKLTICELVNIIGGASFLIGNDSAPVHIAAATHVRSLCICPGGHYGRFLPYPEDMPNAVYNPIVVANMMFCFGCGHNCIHKEINPFLCLKEITAQRVISEVQLCLSNNC